MSAWKCVDVCEMKPKTLPTVDQHIWFAMELGKCFFIAYGNYCYFQHFEL